MLTCARVQLLSELGGSLRSAILRCIGARLRREVPLFQGFNDEAVGFVVSQLQTAVFDIGEVIYSTGDQAVEMFLVVSGTVNLRADASLQHGKTTATAAAAASPAQPGSGDEKKPTGSPPCAERGDVFGELCMFPEDHGAVRRETAIAETWVQAYCLTADRVEKIRASYPEIVVRLREFCAMRALEADSSPEQHGIASAVRGHCLGTQPCRMRKATEGIRRMLISRAEADVLLPAAGPGSSALFHLTIRLPPQPPPTASAAQNDFSGRWVPSLKQSSGFSPARPANGSGPGEKVGSSADGTDHEQQPLQNISCVISTRGELLYVVHGYPRSAIRSLGFIRPGRSTYRALNEQEVTRRSGLLSNGRPLFGCAVLVFPCELSPESEADPADCGQRLVLFSRNLDNLDSFGIAVVRLLLASPESGDRQSPVAHAAAPAGEGQGCDSEPKGMDSYRCQRSASSVESRENAEDSASAELRGLGALRLPGNRAKDALDGDKDNTGAFAVHVATVVLERLEARFDQHRVDIENRIERMLAPISFLLAKANPSFRDEASKTLGSCEVTKGIKGQRGETQTTVLEPMTISERRLGQHKMLAPNPSYVVEQKPMNTTSYENHGCRPLLQQVLLKSPFYAELF